MTTVVNNENKVDMINMVTIPIWEYRDLVTKVARYELLQEQEKQRAEAMAEIRESMAAIERNAPGDIVKPAPSKKAKPAISTEISKK